MVAIGRRPPRSSHRLRHQIVDEPIGPRSLRPLRRSQDPYASPDPHNAGRRRRCKQADEMGGVRTQPCTPNRSRTPRGNLARRFVPTSSSSTSRMDRFRRSSATAHGSSGSHSAMFGSKHRMPSLSTWGHVMNGGWSTKAVRTGADGKPTVATTSIRRDFSSAKVTPTRQPATYRRRG